MKKLSIILIVFSSFFLQAQEIGEKEVTTQIKEVTVFIDGAQINREKKVDLQKGITTLKFTGLSPFVDAKSIQLKADGDLHILSLNFQKNFLNEEKKSEQLKNYESQLKALNDKILLEKTHLAVLKEELDFLKDNRAIGGKNDVLTVANLKETAAFYSEKLAVIKFKEIERNENLEKLSKQKDNLSKQINVITSEKDFPTGEVWIKVEANKTQQAYFNLSYTVENAGWFPSYDIRAKSIDLPLEIVYKANVHQDTKEDWTNVKISFSSSNPKSGGTSPELIPYFLSYNSYPPVYNKKYNTVSGQVISADDNLPLPGATISIQGTTIGTVTDYNGNYSLSIPPNGGVLVCNFIGMKTTERLINNQYINFYLESDQMMLEEVVVAGYANEGMMRDTKGKSATITIRGTSSQIQPITASRVPPPNIQIEKQTSFAFELEKPYSLKSDNKTQTVVMQEISIPASFQYFTIPKIDADAFLMAYVTDWEELNLLEGEATLFFEDTYIGKSLLDVRSAGDTLSVSLGRDKNVQVKREMKKDFSSKQFIGNKKEETKNWTISLKNNKKQSIQMIVLDQIPVPTLEEIELQVQNISGAKYKKEVGELKWEFNLAPLESKLIEVKYTLKYPKGKILNVD